MRPESPRAREGPCIREFLRYYLLVLLREGPQSAGGLAETIGQQSSENRDYRPSGQILVGVRDLHMVLRQLRRRGLSEECEKGWRLTAAGRDKLSEYEKRKEADPDSKGRAARKLLGLMGEPVQGQCALDVGTGEGFLAFKLADKGYRVLGIDSGRFDYSKDSIRSAIRQAESRGGAVGFLETSVADLAQTGRRFDYVVMSQAMHCMKDQGRCLEAIGRLLKPDGAFLCMDFLVGLEGFLHHGWHSFLAISREEWQRLLPQFGFRTPECHKAGDYLVVLARKRRRSRRSHGK